MNASVVTCISVIPSDEGVLIILWSIKINNSNKLCKLSDKKMHRGTPYITGSS